MGGHSRETTTIQYLGTASQAAVKLTFQTPVPQIPSLKPENLGNENRGKDAATTDSTIISCDLHTHKASLVLAKLG